MANGTLKVSNIQTSSGSGTITLGQSGETVTIASGVTQTVAVNTPAFSAYMDSNQTLSNASFTLVNYDTETFDTNSAFNTTNKSFTVPSGEGGKYVIGFKYKSNSSGTINRFIAYINVDGNVKSYHETTQITGGNKPTAQGTTVLNLSAGEVVTIYAYQDSGGNSDLEGDFEDSYFYGYKLIG
jgi:hypothetical protein